MRSLVRSTWLSAKFQTISYAANIQFHGCCFLVALLKKFAFDNNNKTGKSETHQATVRMYVKTNQKQISTQLIRQIKMRNGKGGNENRIEKKIYLSTCINLIY